MKRIWLKALEILYNGKQVFCSHKVHFVTVRMGECKQDKRVILHKFHGDSKCWHSNEAQLSEVYNWYNICDQSDCLKLPFVFCILVYIIYKKLVILPDNSNILYMASKTVIGNGLSWEGHAVPDAQLFFEHSYLQEHVFLTRLGSKN